LETRAAFTPDTVFSVQSVTKPVVATALMQWCDEGRFRLDDPVARDLAPVAVQNDWEAAAPVTFRRLLTHTAGLPVDFGGAADRADSPASLEAFVARVAKTVRPPGEEIVYANYGYDMIGLLLERSGGRPFAEVLRERVLEPLEMRSTFVGRPPEEIEPARGYYLSVVDRQYHAVPHDYEEPSPFPRPAGVLMSTVEDLARFLIAHLNGGMYRSRCLLSPETVAEMHGLHARHGVARNGAGLGFKVDETPAGRFIYHGGDGVGATALIAACPERRAGVALLINLGRAHAARSVIGQAALRALLGDDSPEARPLSRDEAARLSGRYVSNFWGYVADVTASDAGATIEVVGGGLLAEGEGPAPLLRRENGAYVAEGGFFDGFPLEFTLADDGRARSFAGGLYAFRFDRRGDVPTAAVVDEGADLLGAWSGTAASPLGSVPIELAVGPAGATVSALSAHEAPLQAFSMSSGRLAGQFDVALPNLGDFRVFLRLAAVGGRLSGTAYAQGAFGEVAMPTELERE
jgi:CubicO group peptidase (beta-lactamase class C family)